MKLLNYTFLNLLCPCETALNQDALNATTFLNLLDAPLSTPEEEGVGFWVCGGNHTLQANKFHSAELERGLGEENCSSPSSREEKNEALLRMVQNGKPSNNGAPDGTFDSLTAAAPLLAIQPLQNPLTTQILPEVSVQRQRQMMSGIDS